MSSKLEPIQILPGVEPSTDNTATTTQHYTFSKHIRFVGGFPEKIGGWQSVDFSNNQTIAGKVRSIFSYRLSGYVRYLLGTSAGLYDIFSGVLTNITPVKSATIAIADSLDTYYGTLANNPIATVNGSATITVTDTAHKFKAGDTVTLSGSSTVNGIPDSDINGDQFIRSVSTNSYTIIVNTPATSTGSGGGASVVRASGIITVNATAHGLADGNRVKIAAAADTGGITAAQINKEFIIRNVTVNEFDVYTAGTATSSVSAGGGASTTYQEPMDAGSEDTLLGSGYGVGLYGVGLYGVSKTSSSLTLARLWSHDSFGDLTLSAHNNQSDIYSWDGDTAEAPAKVTNSPPANYVFVSNEIAVALGYDTAATAIKGNAISWSDQGGLTNWSTGQAGSDTIEGAGKFISHAAARGENLLFTENQVYTFRYIGGQFIWETKILEKSSGIIAQNARVSAGGAIYWMSNNNFYRWRGGNAEIIPCTILKYVFDNLNYGQKEKIFCHYSEEYQEISWHYPSANSNEPDRIARMNINDLIWLIDEIDRTASEYPSVQTQNPYMADSNSVIFIHENGLNDGDAGMDWQLTTNFIFGGTDTIELEAVIPDMSMTGSINLNIKTKDYPASSSRYNENYTITSSTDRLPVELNGRYWQFDLSGNDLDQQLMIGQWQQELKLGSPK